MWSETLFGDALIFRGTIFFPFEYKLERIFTLNLNVWISIFIKKTF